VTQKSKENQLAEVQFQFEECRLCELNVTRTQLVFGEGNPNSKVVFIGEGPGRDEDLQGKPFVGRSGQLLSEVIFEVFQWNRNHYYITNIVKCRPTIDRQMIKDRPPEKKEIEACHPILLKQLDIIKPKVIVTVGSSATKALLNTKEGITKLRGNWYDFHGSSLMPIFHPSYVLRNGGIRSPQYQQMKSDLELVKNFLEIEK